MVHVLHALKQGKQTIYMHTVDTDVVIVAGMIWCNLTFGRHRLPVWTTIPEVSSSYIELCNSYAREIAPTTNAAK